MPITSSTSTSSRKNFLLILLIILVVALFGILIGLLAFLVSTRNNNQVVTTNNSSSSKQTSSYSSISTNSVNSTSANSTETSLSTTSSNSSVSFSHNEGKFIRFDYPTGWKVDVRSSKADGTFSSFSDIEQVSIANGETSLALSGYGMGCIGEEPSYYIDKSNMSELKETTYFRDSSFNVVKNKETNVNISNFQVKELNLDSAKGYLLIQYTKDSAQNIKVAKLENDSYKFSDCMSNTIFLNNDLFGQSTHLLVYPNNNRLSLSNLATIIENFLNSFQKK